ncbi:DUF3721 domain-containing protein [Cyanobium sp. PCC 7001]|uniref:DUF3721 domain-containing protein n=1 Tax=Cyanobium sp. PCC 7001 TaxID=180281 RepID=UPI0005B9003C|nr:DUF3721 domain-containing protein [Cyanobium sp. PCC 7001]
MNPSPIRLLAAATCLLATLAPAATTAHSKGLYKTKAEAQQRARELGCSGTHQNNGSWMPCSNEAHLHQELRKQ